MVKFGVVVKKSTGQTSITNWVWDNQINQEVRSIFETNTHINKTMDLKFPDNYDVKLINSQEISGIGLLDGKSYIQRVITYQIELEG